MNVVQTIIQLIQALFGADPNLIKDISGLIHHKSPTPGPTAGTGPGGGAPEVAPAIPTPGAPSAPPSAFSPIPGKVTILGAKRFGVPLIPVPDVFDEETSIHLDLNLGNPAPWPKGAPDGDGVTPWNPQIVYLWDGQRSDADPVEPGSIDKDGYAGRFNIHALPDDHQHTLRIAFQVNGKIGPWLTHSVHKGANAVYHAGFYRCEDSGVSAGKPATGVKVAVFYNGQHKELATPDLPYSAPPDVVEAWIKTNPPLKAILKSPFKF